jgi:hypothetical protein
MEPTSVVSATAKWHVRPLVARCHSALAEGRHGTRHGDFHAQCDTPHRESMPLYVQVDRRRIRFWNRVFSSPGVHAWGPGCRTTYPSPFRGFL